MHHLMSTTLEGSNGAQCHKRNRIQFVYSFRLYVLRMRRPSTDSQFQWRLNVKNISRRFLIPFNWKWALEAEHHEPEKKNGINRFAMDKTSLGQAFDGCQQWPWHRQLPLWFGLLGSVGSCRCYLTVVSSMFAISIAQHSSRIKKRLRRHRHCAFVAHQQA